LIHDSSSNVRGKSVEEVKTVLLGTLSIFTAPKRRTIAEQVRRLGTGKNPEAAPDDGALDLARAAPAVQTVAGILGLLPAPAGPAGHGAGMPEPEVAKSGR